MTFICGEELFQHPFSLSYKYQVILLHLCMIWGRCLEINALALAVSAEFKRSTAEIKPVCLVTKCQHAE